MSPEATRHAVGLLRELDAHSADSLDEQIDRVCAYIRRALGPKQCVVRFQRGRSARTWEIVAMSRSAWCISAIDVLRLTSCQDLSELVAAAVFIITGESK
jgi:hypothetical protein